MTPKVTRAALAVLLVLASIACTGGVPSAEPAAPTAALATGPAAATPTIAPPTTSTPPPPSLLPVVGHLLIGRGIDPLPDEDPLRPRSVYSAVDLSSGERVELTAGFAASWSGTGDRIHVVLRDRTCVPTLETYGVDGRRLAAVDDGFAPLDLGFTWSADDSMVAFLRFQDGPPAGMCGAQGGAYEPEDTVQDIVVMRADGSGMRTLLRGVHATGLSWSPDGRTIATRAAVGEPAEDRSEVLLVEVATGRVTQLPASVSGIDLRTVGPPSFSPDGAYLAVPTWRDEAWRIVVVDPSLSAARDVGVAGDLQPMSWSPSGDGIAVARGLDAAQLWLLDPAGREADRRVGQPEFGSHLYCWLAGGDWIAILGEPAVMPGEQLPPGWSVFLQPTAGSEPRVAVPAEAGWAINDLGCAP